VGQHNARRGFVRHGSRRRADPNRGEEIARRLEAFDPAVAAARQSPAKASNEHFANARTLLSNGQTIMTTPRIALFRTFITNHLIHLRAQLGACLRLNDIPAEAIYGRSADETGMQADSARTSCAAADWQRGAAEGGSGAVAARIGRRRLREGVDHSAAARAGC
jgi:hypothetical protein